MGLGIAAVGPLVNGFGKVFVHVLTTIDTFTAASAACNDLFGVMMTSGASLDFFFNNSGANPLLAVGGRSVTTDGFQSRTGLVTIPTGSLISIAGLWDFAGDAIRPYVNGVVDNPGAATFANSAYTHSASGTALDRIGCTGATAAGITTTRQNDGRESELSIWNASTWSDAVANAVAAQLAANIRANTVPCVVSGVALAHLIDYMKLLGNDSPETSTVGTLQGTITGTIAQAAHPTMTDAVLAAPGISPNGGTFAVPTEVTLSALSDAVVYYTLDGSTPDATKTLYSAPFTISATATLKTITTKTGLTASAVASADFTITEDEELTESHNNTVPCFETSSGPNVVECYETESGFVPVRITTEAPNVVPIVITTQAPNRVPIKKFS
jgi:hypothetical protein